MQRYYKLSVLSGLVLLTLGLVSCRAPLNSGEFSTLNSRFTDEQPTLSGDGRYLAFVSNRTGQRNLLVYDIRSQRFLNLPRLNRKDVVVEHPSLSQTGRYLVYLASDRGRTEIELYDRVTQRTDILTVAYRGLVRNPSISPDGRYVTFETGRRGQWDLEVIDRGVRIELDLPQGAPVTGPAIEQNS